jgi:hypothetical protein
MVIILTMITILITIASSERYFFGNDINRYQIDKLGRAKIIPHNFGPRQ